MTPTTLVMAYYENAAMLREHFRQLRALPADVRDMLHVVIVDDGSPQAPAQPEDLAGISLQIYRMQKDVRWNQDACRNVGVRHSETDWVMLTDIDHVVPLATWRVIMGRSRSEKAVYTFARVSAPDMEVYKPHPNSWLMTRAMYDRAGGYDERFAGFYGTDGDFRNRLATVAKMALINEPIIRVPRTMIHDASTTTYLRKQPEDRVAINRIKAERDMLNKQDRAPLRYLFAYDRVWPKGVTA